MALRIGIIGCGGIAGMHVRGYRVCSDVELVACADLVLERAKNFAGAHNIPRVYDDYKKMLANERLDAVSICTPNYAHCDPTCDALAAGINVLCEKPIAMNADEAACMVRAAHKSKAVLSIGHHLRFQPFIQYAKRMLAGGELGDIYFGRSHALRRRGIPGWGAFHIKAKSGGGPLIDIGVHSLDLIIWLMGSPEPETVTGSVYTQFGNKPEYFSPHGNYRREEYDVEDFACGLVKFTNGASLMLEASWAGHLPELEHHPQVLLGNKGGMQVNPFGANLPPLKVFMTREEALIDVEPHGFPAVEPHIEEVKYWVSCVRGENPVLVKPEESLNVQRIIDALYKSSESRREVLVEPASKLNGASGNGNGTPRKKAVGKTRAKVKAR